VPKETAYGHLDIYTTGVAKKVDRVCGRALFLWQSRDGEREIKMFILPVWIVAIAILIWLERRSKTERMT